MTDATTMLDKAVVTAKAMGVSCTGWMAQRHAEGFVAWLYVTDETGRMLSLMGDVESFPSLLQAAAWYLAVVEAYGEE